MTDNTSSLQDKWKHTFHQSGMTLQLVLQLVIKYLVQQIAKFNSISVGWHYTTFY